MPSINSSDVLAALEAENYLRTYERASFFRPYPTQLAFIAASRDHYELLLSAGNGTGKTAVGAYIEATHLTGEYPDWWPGRRWTRPIDAWACGPATDITRESSQLMLVGRLDEDHWGSGMIPLRCLPRDLAKKGSGSADSLDTIRVKHVSGGMSTLGLKTYTQDPRNWQGPRIDLVWFDEEPWILQHYTEALARLMGRDGLAYMTFTPLAGPTEVVKRFIDDDEPSRQRFEMSMDEAEHIGPEEKARKLREYPPHEREARYYGRISLGEGRVYPVPELDLMVDVSLQRVPPEWCKLWGIDFGINHPFAAVLYAWDREMDEHYILAEIRMRDAIPLQHATAMRRIAANVPVAWPRDGMNREKGSGEPLANAYKSLGLQMLAEPASLPGGSYSKYAGVTQIGIIEGDRRWKVNRSCTEYFGERRMYHFRDGKIVDRDNDLLDAARYAYMFRRRARAVPLGGGLGRRPQLRRGPASPIRYNPWTGMPERYDSGV